MVTMFCVVIVLSLVSRSSWQELSKIIVWHVFLLKSSNLCFAEGFVIQLKVPAVPEIDTPFSQDFWEGQPSDNPKSNWSFLREENYPRSVVHITCDTYLLISCNRSFCSKLSIQNTTHKWLNGLVGSGSSCKQTYCFGPPSMTNGSGICSEQPTLQLPHACLQWSATPQFWSPSSAGHQYLVPKFKEKNWHMLACITVCSKQKHEKCLEKHMFLLCFDEILRVVLSQVPGDGKNLCLPALHCW